MKYFRDLLGKLIPEKRKMSQTHNCTSVYVVSSSMDPNHNRITNQIANTLSI